MKFWQLRFFDTGRRQTASRLTHGVSDIPQFRVPRSTRRWLACLALAAPAAWPYVAHFLAGDNGVEATGFIQYDMPYYMANAREHFDNGSVTYGNPFSPSYTTPAIYFQPLTLVLGILWRLTGADPGVVFVSIGAVAALFCVRAAVALYSEVAGLETRSARLGLVAFVWGGGLLALAGLAASFYTGRGELFRFDPQNGYWFLNFGRTMVYPTEAFYHALFFGSIACILKKRFALALMFAFVLSASHPFTGLELLAILLVWSFIETYFMERRELGWSFVVLCGGLLALHLAYYVVFLGQFEEHRRLVAQWHLPRLLQAENFIPAYVLVGGLAAWSVRRLRLAKTFFDCHHNRLFLVWFVVAFALANHEFAIDPVQPLHFERGYVWTSLFLLGIPALLRLFDYFRERLTRRGAALCASLALAVFLSDNMVWFATYTTRGNSGFLITWDEKDLFRWLNETENSGFTVLSQSPRIAYLATTYTPLRSWYSHQANTPDFARRRAEAEAYFGGGVFLDRWKDLPLLIVHTNHRDSDVLPDPPEEREVERAFQNETFTVMRLDTTSERRTRLTPCLRLDAAP